MNTLIEGNIYTHSIHAVLVGQGSSNTFRGNKIEDVWENGLYLHGGSHNIFQGNTIREIAPGYAGLHVTGNESRITSNTISQAGTCLFVNYGGDEATMTLEDNYPNGVDRFPQIIPLPSKIVYTIYVYKLDGAQP